MQYVNGVARNNYRVVFVHAVYDLFIQSLVQMEVSIFCLTKFDEIYKCLAE